MSGTTQAAQPAGHRHDFAGKVAIVTGAAKGVGEAYARALADAGAARRWRCGWPAGRAA